MNDKEITVRVGHVRVHFYPVEGGMSCEVFGSYGNHPQGDWYVAHDDDMESPSGREALRLAYAIRDMNGARGADGDGESTVNTRSPLARQPGASIPPAPLSSHNEPGAWPHNKAVRNA